ncbi:YdeI/OmpD-associated family protein [Vagococcus coleopterorum]|uniref:YdeI/OmpD-associated family protein n=1 Tax=Vagococcus coleopterorum TaxID=2714946 RepID=A0A6G8AKX8_9ENTE|nr:YdeI/OmpD-associated family protein [Vagococcus coleopterorum]QIL45656.1 YdeI/OmpD-associated family protein [Vagococcus coleopterorum]
MMETVLGKLKIKETHDLVMVGTPENYGNSPYNEVANLAELKKSARYLFIFVKDKNEFKEVVLNCDRHQLKESGYLFVVYPKLANKLGLEGVHRDEIFPMLSVDEDTGLVAGKDLKFNRMVSFDDNYTVVGLKQVDPEKEKKVKKACNEDYASHIPELAELLGQTDRGAFDFFVGLTKGYQKSWAQHVFSAKQQATQMKRLEQTVMILKAGHKSLNLYQQAQKQA